MTVYQEVLRAFSESMLKDSIAEPGGKTWCDLGMNEEARKIVDKTSYGYKAREGLQVYGAIEKISADESPHWSQQAEDLVKRGHLNPQARAKVVVYRIINERKLNRLIHNPPPATASPEKWKQYLSKRTTPKPEAEAAEAMRHFRRALETSDEPERLFAEVLRRLATEIAKIGKKRRRKESHRPPSRQK